MAFKREKVVAAAEKYVAKGKIEAAIKEYRKVLAETPNDSNTLNRVGDLYAREANLLLKEGVELFDNDELVHRLGEIGHHLGVKGVGEAEL